jgi:hypothetical protein
MRVLPACVQHPYMVVSEHERWQCKQHWASRCGCRGRYRVHSQLAGSTYAAEYVLTETDCPARELLSRWIDWRPMRVAVCAVFRPVLPEWYIHPL